MVLLKSFSIVLAIFSVTVHVRSQTCESTNAYSPCSSNAACGCLPLIFTDNIGICGLLGVSCSRLNPCQSDDTCQSSDHICIRHPRCSSTPLCYPLSLSDQRLCPAMSTTRTSTAMPFFTTQTTTEITTEFETTDYDFNDTTKEVYPPLNSIRSNYSNVLTTNSNIIFAENKYYQVIEIHVNTSGYYDIRSLSTMDTYGCLHYGNYDPSHSSNRIACNDDYNGNQFRLVAYLQADVLYTLLFTTYSANVIGSYSVIAYGPGKIEFNPVYITQVTSITDFVTNSTATSQSYTNSIYSSASTTSSTFTSGFTEELISNNTDNITLTTEYSSELSTSNKKFSRPTGSGGDYYYRAIEIKVNTTGLYTFTSRSSTSGSIADTTIDYTSVTGSYMNNGNMDAYGCIYRTSFSPNSPSMNLLQYDDDSAGNLQFRLTVTLQAHISYVLVFTTFIPNTIGSFSIMASGPDYLVLNDI